MRVLVACECSGIIREAFSRIGFDAWSCDLKPAEIPGQHFQQSIFDVINQTWDLLIGHPPCTYLSYAANNYWHQPGRARKRIEALDFFLQLWEAPIKHICLENPLGIVDRVITPHTQIIHPYYFGDSEKKRTCLWLKNLPPLVHTKTDTLFETKTHTAEPEPDFIWFNKHGKKKAEYYTYSKNPEDRSRSFQGIANAMADQWGNYLMK